MFSHESHFSPHSGTRSYLDTPLKAAEVAKEKHSLARSLGGHKGTARASLLCSATAATLPLLLLCCCFMAAEQPPSSVQEEAS